MTPAAYDAWYDRARGRWIGETEYRLLAGLLGARPGESLLDVGCGTGWFSRRFAAAGLRVTGIDTNQEWLAWAARRAGPPVDYRCADARKLPFADRSFDRVASVTALCFIDAWPQAIEEMVRVCRHRFVLGLLNRCSLLWLQKHAAGAAGAYAGAHWHTRAEIAAAAKRLPIRNLRFAYAVFLPSGSPWARRIEPIVGRSLPLGSFLAVSADAGAPQ